MWTSEMMATTRKVSLSTVSGGFDAQPDCANGTGSFFSFGNTETISIQAKALRYLVLETKMQR